MSLPRRRPNIRRLTPAQRAVYRAWRRAHGADDQQIAESIGMKPAAFSRKLQRALARLQLSRFTASLRRGDRPHTIRPMSLSGYFKNGEHRQIVGV